LSASTFSRTASVKRTTIGKRRQHRTILTWIKPPPFGLGSYYRNSTEQCLFATPAAASIPTHFITPRGEHSEKPEAFYDIVRAASYPPYVKRGKNEAADAEAICEAVARPTMRFVGVMNRSPPILRGFGFRSNEYGFNC
jgi:hypothetical protein